MKPKVLIGCPVYHRAWALPKWLEALLLQKDLEVSLAFCLTKGGDRTEDIVIEESQKGRFAKVLVDVYTGTLPEGTDRDWSQEDRVRVVAEKRNRLLDLVGNEEFDYFLMLDSDVFVPEKGLLRLVETLKFENFDAACPKVWVWEALYVAARYERGKVAFLPRRETGVQPVDIVSSSACLMVPRLAKDRAVRYGVAVRGQDFGWAPGSEVNGWNYSECISWSKNAKARQYRLAANCNLTFEHKMTVEA